MSEISVKVAVGVVVDELGRVLVSKRPVDKHQGGLWEFPGGKIEQNESACDALARELEEEVGIAITASEPLIRIRHDYSDKSVCLEVLRVTGFRGDAWGREGQEIAWVRPADLPALEFPAANTPIVAAARLPRQLMVTGAFDSEKDFLTKLRRGLQMQPGMAQFRAPWLTDNDYIDLARKAHEICVANNIPLLANCTLESFQKIQCEGLHLTSAALMAHHSRPVAADIWLSAACHNPSELNHAERIGVDFVSVSPVKTTGSHADAIPLGWEKFAVLADTAKLPVYALGGMGIADSERALAEGGQGIAAIGAFWRES